MKVETAQVNSSAATSSSAVKNPNSSANFNNLLDLLTSSDITISKTLSEEEIRAREQKRKTEILLDLVERLTGEKPELSLDDVIDISGENTGAMNVTLNSSGFDKLRQTLEANPKIPAETNVSISPTLIQISGKPAETPSQSTTTIPSANTTSQPASPAPKRIDPIVISIGKSAASLRNGDISFDIDGDGTFENIALLGENDYLVAIDRNKNGIIDSGNELFGPSSGDGFLELKSLDSNNDNKLDNTDSDFGMLQLLEFSTTQKQFLHTLSAKGIENIYLNTSKTVIQLSDENKNLRAEITEKGTVRLGNNQKGAVQHLDFFT